MKIKIAICYLSLSLSFFMIGCATPVVIIKDAHIDLLENTKVSPNLLGIWTSDKKSSPDGNMAIFADAHNYYYRALTNNELLNVTDSLSYLKGKVNRNLYSPQLLKIGDNYFGIQKLKSADIKDLPKEMSDTDTPLRTIIMLSDVSSDSVTVFNVDADRLENIFPIQKPFYHEIITFFSELLSLKNRFSVKYSWMSSVDKNYSLGPRLDKTMMFVLNDNYEIFLKICAQNNVFNREVKTFKYVNTFLSSDKSAIDRVQVAKNIENQKKELLISELKQKSLLITQRDSEYILDVAYPLVNPLAAFLGRLIYKGNDLISSVDTGNGYKFTVKLYYLNLAKVQHYLDIAFYYDYQGNGSSWDFVGHSDFIAPQKLTATSLLNLILK